ncbi:MAG: gamma carbonic anhydrase family protein [Lachnospiraceae bacterium]|nr:gamma carbonic anhydrase family protein [Lachnospiraceae bacterium]
MELFQNNTEVFRAEGSRIIGAVSFGKECSVWYNAVIRGDDEPIRIGTRTNIQDNCVLHVDTGFPMEIGSDVTVGHGSILHGCIIGDNSLIGMGSILLNGARVGKNCIIGAGSLVTQGKEIPDGMLAYGNPVKVVRPLSDEEIEDIRMSAEHYANQASRQG